MNQKKQIFHKKFDRYFLFLDNEIVNNEIFYSRVKSFSVKNKSHDLIIELMNLEINDKLGVNSVFRKSNSAPDSLEALANEYIYINKTFEDLLFEFLIYDTEGNWSIYCNIGYDYGLGACDNYIYKLFIDEIAPYEKFSLEEKQRDIESNFTDDEKRKFFVSDLFSKYDFLNT